VANIIAFYVRLPMAWILCFNLKLGVNGLMMGIAFGTLFLVIVLAVLILWFESYVYSPVTINAREKIERKIDFDEVLSVRNAH
jgi:hypothetical protein